LKSYFGLRKLAIDGRRILVNDKPVFQRRKKMISAGNGL